MDAAYDHRARAVNLFILSSICSAEEPGVGLIQSSEKICTIARIPPRSRWI